MRLGHRGVFLRKDRDRNERAEDGDCWDLAPPSIGGHLDRQPVFHLGEQLTHRSVLGARHFDLHHFTKGDEGGLVRHVDYGGSAHLPHEGSHQGREHLAEGGPVS